MEGMDYGVPFANKVEFIQAVACLASVHRCEMHRRTNAESLAACLQNTTKPRRAAWYLNIQFHMHSLPPGRTCLLPSGTTSNETLHSELKNVFRQNVRYHQATLEIKLQAILLGKLLAHESNLVRPTLRQRPQGQLLARLVSTDMVGTEVWASVCPTRTSARPLPRSKPRPRCQATTRRGQGMEFIS